MAMMTKSTTLRWPRPQDLQLDALHPYYDRDLDLLVLSFTLDPLPRVEVPLQSLGGLTPLASVRLGEQNSPTGDVIGVMVENLSDGFTQHPEWRILTKGRINRKVLASLIATFSPLPEESDEPEVRPAHR